MRLSKLLLAMTAGLALADGARGNITYEVNLQFGNGGVVGWLTTDGKTGVLGAADVLAWNFTVIGNDGATQNLVNGPSGVEVGNRTATFNPSAGTPDLTADVNHIYFNFSATDGGYFGFQILPFYGGNNYWSCGAHDNNDSYSGLAAVPVLFDDPTAIFVPEKGKQIIASATNGAPFITAEPLNTLADSGSNVTLQVAAMGNAPLTYEWFFNGKELANSSEVTGATSSNLTLLDVAAKNGGKYDVVVKSAKSFTAVLTIAGSGNPEVTITYPKAGESIPHTNQVFLTVTGTTKDKTPVVDVYYQLNSEGWSTAIPVNGWSSWKANLSPVAGSNLVSVYAVDASQKMSTNSVTFKYLPTGVVDVVIPAGEDGKVTPSVAGKKLGLGTNYTFKAEPAKNWYFTTWIGSGSQSFVSNNPTLKINLQGDLTLQANFKPSPFLVEQGTFSGLFMDTNGVTEASSGFITLALTETGSFSGKLMTAGETYSLPTKTKFGTNGAVNFTAPTKGGNLVFTLQLNVADLASNQITGTVTDGTWTANLTADRAVFSATKNKATNYEGNYTLAIAGSNGATNSPEGYGNATLSVNPAGQIVMSGSLADGTAIGQSVSVSQDGRWPFYASYAAPPKGNGGSVFSWITFSNATAPAMGGTAYWFRPAGKIPAVYQDGFSNTAQIVLSGYNAKAKPLLALTAGEVTLEGGNLPFVIGNLITLASNNVITLANAPENTNKLALTISKTSGAISGSFANPSNPKESIKVHGVLLQNQNSAVGYFLGTNQSGAFNLNPAQ